uniref:Uncharacterized protein n=1 Tax=Phasianus colchicus TaxID=9054 RepID=A0A669QG62_PHACC
MGLWVGYGAGYGAAGLDMGPMVGSPSALRVALAGAWQAVRGRRLRHFPRVLALLEAVGRAAPAALSCHHLDPMAAILPIPPYCHGCHLVPMAAILSHWPPSCPVGRHLVQHPPIAMAAILSPWQPS